MTFRIGEPVSVTNPLPVVVVSTDGTYNPGEPISDTNPAPVGGLTGGKISTATASLSVGTAAGVIGTVVCPALTSPVTFARTGGSTDLSINATTGAVTTAAGIAAGANENILGYGQDAAGNRQTFNYTFSGVVTLVTLGGTFTLPESALAGAIAGAITGKSATSQITLFDDAGGRVAISGTNIVRGASALDYESGATFPFTVRETDANASPSVHDTVFTFTITNVAEIAISGTAPGGTVGTAYSFTPSTTGGWGPKSFTLSGNLPAGLSFAQATGRISGTPTTQQTAGGLSIMVTDLSGNSSLATFSIVIAPAVSATNNNLDFGANSSGFSYYYGVM